MLYNRNFTEKYQGQEELTTIRHRQQWEQDTKQKQTTQKKKSKTKLIKKTNIESDEQHVPTATNPEL